MKTYKLAHSPLLSFALVAFLISLPAGGATYADKRIESMFIGSYVYQRFLLNDLIHVTCADGIVVLSGVAGAHANSLLAEEVASQLPGVIRVSNQLSVAAGSAPENSDEWISLKVKTALLLQRYVSSFITQVSTEDGSVTLSGRASSGSHRRLATAYAQDVTGVKQVRNEMK